MDKEINRIRLIKLSSEHEVFEPIIFHDGVNLILGEKYDEATVQGRKTNGVGKSMSMACLDFCLLNDYGTSRIKRIPSNILPMEEYLILEMEIGGHLVTIKRNRKDEKAPIIIKDDKVVSFEKLEEARHYLAELTFNQLGGKSIPSFRNLLSILIRDERSEFTDILKCYDVKKNIPIDLSVHLYMLGISLEKYKQTLMTIKEIDKLNTVITKNRKDLTQNSTKKIADVKAELNSLDDEIEKMEAAIESFKSNESFERMEKDLLELESALEQLRRKQKVLRYEQGKIRRMPKPETIDDEEIELVYNQFKEDLGSSIVKSLNEVIGFKNKVETFQRMLVNQKAQELEVQLKEIADKIRDLDEQYAEKLKIIDQKGVLKNLKASLKIYEAKKDEYAQTKFLYSEYEKHNKQKKALKLQKTQELMEIDQLIEVQETVVDDFIATLLSIHEQIMGNKECAFTIQTIDKANNKIPVEIGLRIYDDGSHSVNRTKVFIYDMALLFNKYTRLHHPLFLVHDNIFDVDQDTLVQCLNYLNRQEEKYQDFQYILTLNRDKIENEERAKLIEMDIEKHKVAMFTKENKFFKQDYQEK